jgi:hypothetical protein
VEEEGLLKSLGMAGAIFEDFQKINMETFLAQSRPIDGYGACPV